MYTPTVIKTLPTWFLLNYNFSAYYIISMFNFFVKFRQHPKINPGSTPGGLVYYVLGRHILYESESIIGHCTCWVVGEWFLCIVVLRVWVDFGEVVYCVRHADAYIFITWLDDNGWVIFEAAQRCLFPKC